MAFWGQDSSFTAGRCMPLLLVLAYSKCHSYGENDCMQTIVNASGYQAWTFWLSSPAVAREPHRILKTFQLWPRLSTTGYLLWSYPSTESLFCYKTFGPHLPYKLQTSKPNCYMTRAETLEQVFGWANPRKLNKWTRGVFLGSLQNEWGAYCLPLMAVIL